MSEKPQIIFLDSTRADLPLAEIVDFEPVLNTPAEITRFHENRRALMVERAKTAAAITATVSGVGAVGYIGYVAVVDVLPAVMSGVAIAAVWVGKALAVVAGFAFAAVVLAGLLSSLFNGTKEVRQNTTAAMNRRRQTITVTQTQTTTIAND